MSMFLYEDLLKYLSVTTCKMAQVQILCLSLCDSYTYLN